MKPERCLVLNGAGAGRGLSNLIALLEGGTVIAQQSLAGRGASERFAPTVQALLAQAGWSHPPDLLAAIIGPGSFTGLRASLSLAAGLARGWSCQGVGVRLGDAMRASLQRKDATILCLARRGRVFVDPPGNAVYALPVEEISPGLWPAIAGDAVYGEDALPDLTGAMGEARLGRESERLPLAAPTAEGIFQAAIEGLQTPQSYALEPLYIDPPEARPPAGGLRLAPR
ncbi:MULTISPECIES: tRNA (adenosine(37)-N6)-threonylcarbamoyltransferase complex dimerization subunit type 1 TsaB [Bombella]|uniref:tRNA (Adenosine(37)-N6)-threonylcarbamoyltransferase complex dimerization subunit type 1 TsaB n=1 Tax=Bombella pollinis TaxID=2967337 RepID=A0ABT3WMM3_9PROT|nr:MULTISPECIES: tRNA (adenosine(37)-N6)-threonylcarbamoyltransferase complex dimerization subunit type 1 TsaB [Bombella]MCX5620350.1 tRNA (adenosine(37)-N6)-threonylcarbamoyltransferase complex dimerization subunit type 1 TsaB [Bombella pollinis]